MVNQFKCLNSSWDICFNLSNRTEKHIHLFWVIWILCFISLLDLDASLLDLYTVKYSIFKREVHACRTVWNVQDGPFVKMFNMVLWIHLRVWICFVIRICQDSEYAQGSEYAWVCSWAMLEYIWICLKLNLK